MAPARMGVAEMPERKRGTTRPMEYFMLAVGGPLARC